MCAGNAVFFHTKVVSESKIAREMLCFTIETAVRLCEVRRCKTAVADVLAYGRLCSPYARIGLPLGSASASGKTHWNGGFQVTLGCGWQRCVIGEWHGRFPWWCGVIGECHWKWSNALEWFMSGGMVALCYWGMAWQVSMLAPC